jgi:hypothetical protein
VKLPSVTRVLKPFSDFSMIRPDVLRLAAERGTRVHAAVSSHARGLWADSAMVAGDRPFFSSFLQWEAVMQPRYVSVEEEMKDPALGYMGHPDKVALLLGDAPDCLTVIDWKTPLSVSKTWFPQIAAYAHLARKAGYPVKRGVAIRLRKDGSFPKLTEVDIDGEPWAAFLNALGAWKYFNLNK